MNKLLLIPYGEFRFTISNIKFPIKIKLLSGTAEYLGKELIKDNEYNLYYNTGCILTYHGCELEVDMNTNSEECCYKSLSNQSWIESIVALLDNNLTGNIVIVGDNSKLILAKYIQSYIMRRNTNNHQFFIDLNDDIDPCYYTAYKLDTHSNGMIDIPLFDDTIHNNSNNKLTVYCDPGKKAIDQFHGLFSGEVGSDMSCIIHGNSDLRDIDTKQWDIKNIIVVGDEMLQQKLSKEYKDKVHYIASCQSYTAPTADFMTKKRHNYYMNYFYNNSIINNKFKKITQYPKQIILTWNSKQWYQLRSKAKKLDSNMLPIRTAEEKQIKDNILLETLYVITDVKVKRIVNVCTIENHNTVPVVLGLLLVQEINEITKTITVIVSVAEEFPKQVAFCKTSNTYMD
jgi:hypothetical protein